MLSTINLAELYEGTVTKPHIYLVLPKPIGKVTQGGILIEICNHMWKCKSF